MGRTYETAARIRVDPGSMRALLRRLSRVGHPATQRRIARRAMDVGLTPVLKDARALVPVETQTLKRSLGKRIRTYSRSGTTVGLVGPRRKMGRTIAKRIKTRRGTKFIMLKGKVPLIGHGGRRVDEYRLPTKYAHLVEFGTVKTRAKPFLRPAWDHNKLKVRALIGRKVYQEVLREARRG